MVKKTPVAVAPANAWCFSVHGMSGSAVWSRSESDLSPEGRKWPLAMHGAEAKKRPVKKVFFFLPLAVAVVNPPPLVLLYSIYKKNLYCCVVKRQERRSGQLAARQPASGCAWLGLLRPRCWIPGMLVSRTEPMDRIRRRKGQLKLVRASPVSSVHGRDGPCKRSGEARVLAREASQPARARLCTHLTPYGPEDGQADRPDRDATNPPAPPVTSHRSIAHLPQKSNNLRN